MWLIGGFVCRSIESYITVGRMIKTKAVHKFRCSCGYFPGQNFSGNCSKCIALISVRGAEKRGVNRREESRSPPARTSKSIKVKGGPPTTKRPKKDVVARASDDDFELSPIPEPRPAPNVVRSPLKNPASPTVPQSAGKLAGYQAAAGMFPKAVLKVFRKATEGLGKKQRQALEQAPQPQATKKTWSQFPQGQDVSPDSAARKEAAAAAAAEISPAAAVIAGAHDKDDNDDGEGDADIYDVHNASAVNAAQQQATSHNDVHIDLGDAAGSTMASWWETFMTGSRGGGFLARSLFSAAAQDSVLAENRWVGPTSVTQKKQALLDMRIKFLEWTEVPSTNEWVRSKLFNIIVTNPKTYSMLKVFTTKTRLLFINSRFLK